MTVDFSNKRKIININELVEEMNCETMEHQSRKLMTVFWFIYFF